MTIEQNNVKKLQQRNYNLVVENEFLKEENAKLKERKSKLVSENVKLQNELFTEQLNEDETEYYINNLKQQNTQLKQKINAQSKLIERLITIITDENYN